MRPLIGHAREVFFTRRNRTEVNAAVIEISLHGRILDESVPSVATEKRHGERTCHPDKATFFRDWSRIHLIGSLFCASNLSPAAAVKMFSAESAH